MGELAAILVMGGGSRMGELTAILVMGGGSRMGELTAILVMGGGSRMGDVAASLFCAGKECVVGAATALTAERAIAEPRTTHETFNHDKDIRKPSAFEAEF